MKTLITLGALATLMSANAYADDLASGITQGWSGEASVSGSTTSGNTSTTDVGLALHLQKEDGPWKNKFDTTYDLGRTSGTNSKNRFFIGYQLDRKINDRLYAYGNANYFTDDFGPFKQGSFLGAGLGYELIQPAPIHWSLEAGAGYRSQKSRESGIIPSFKENELALRGGSQFKYDLNEAVSFYNNSEIIWSDSDTYIWNDTGITANLSGNLAARFSFRVDNHSSVPVGTKKTDTITRAAIVYTLK
jgi:putative salt-induced outer membrane protein